MERIKNRSCCHANCNLFILLYLISISIKSIYTLDANDKIHTKNAFENHTENVTTTQENSKLIETTTSQAESFTPSTALSSNINTVELNRSLSAVDVKVANDTSQSLSLPAKINNTDQINASTSTSVTVDYTSSSPEITKWTVPLNQNNVSSSPLVAPTTPPALLAPNTKKGEDCSGFRKLDEIYQPKYSDKARIKKCCQLGQNYKMSSDGIAYCGAGDVEFQAPSIEAIFYEHCIEDTERKINLSYEFGNTCTDRSIAGNSLAALSEENAYIYSKNYGDLLYVLQNGSLLRVDVNFTAYDIFDHYCLDMDQNDKVLTAIVCGRKFSTGRISKAEVYLYAICMIVSVPCLLITAFLYLRIRELRDLHGKALACHSISLAFGFLFLSIVQMRGYVTRVLSYFIQYSILSCFFWLGVMCADIFIHIWWLLPRHQNLTQKDRNFYFIMYAVASFGLPLVLVHFPFKKRTLGVPLSYLKGISSELTGSHYFFILPITIILILCLILLIAAYIGFRVNKPPKITTTTETSIENNGHRKNSFAIQKNVDYEHFQEVKKAAKSTAFLFTIMSINTSFEIVMHYITEQSAGAPTPILFFDILTATQGIVIFIIFVCLPSPIQIVKRWWIVQGTLDLNMTEMEVLNVVSITKS